MFHGFSELVQPDVKFETAARHLGDGKPLNIQQELCIPQHLGSFKDCSQTPAECCFWKFLDNILLK